MGGRSYEWKLQVNGIKHEFINVLNCKVVHIILRLTSLSPIWGRHQIKFLWAITFEQIKVQNRCRCHYYHTCQLSPHWSVTHPFRCHDSPVLINQTTPHHPLLEIMTPQYPHSHNFVIVVQYFIIYCHKDDFEHFFCGN